MNVCVYMHTYTVYLINNVVSYSCTVYFEIFDISIELYNYIYIYFIHVNICVFSR